MNVRLILTKCYSLVFRESQLEKVSTSNKEFILNIIREIQMDDNPTHVNPEAKKLYGLRDLIVKICREGNGDTFDQAQALSELRLICDDDSTLYDSIKEEVGIELDEKDINLKLINIRHQITNILKEEKIKKIIQVASNTIHYRPYEVKDMRSFVNGVINELTTYVDTTDQSKDPAIMNEISLVSGDGVAEVFREARNEAKGDSTFPFPWKCINRMTRGGLRRAQTTVVAALQHHNKSGFCLASCIGFALYSQPEITLTDKTKKPAIVYISLENEVGKILGDIYLLLKENFEGVKVDDETISKIQPNVASKYVSEMIGKNGYELIILRANPSEWTYMDLFANINSIEARNYEIHVCCIDYLNQLPKTGCNGGNDADKIQDLFNRARNFFSKKNIALFTPHQLSTEALELHRQGRQDLAAIVSNGNYYHASKGIGREVDLEIFLHYVKESGRAYQSIARGKHRLIGVTKEEYLQCIIPFEDIGGLRFDYASDFDVSIKKIGQKRSDDGAIIDTFW